MKKTLNLKKSDLLTDSLDAFWGKGAATIIPSPQVDSTPQDIIQPTENAFMQSPQLPSEQNYNETGSIKEQVERGTQDVVPDTRVSNQMMGMPPTAMPSQPQARPVQQRNPFDLGGFDAMIQSQLSRERGAFGITPSGGYGGIGSMSDVERFAKRRQQYSFDVQKRSAEHQLKYKQLAMGTFAQEARAKQDISQQIIRNYREAANKQRMQAGLPVYESPWDILAGGKRKVADFQKRPIYDKKGEISGYKDVNVGDKLERYGGLAGAYQELRPVGRGAKSLTKKAASGISDLYSKGYKKLSTYNEKKIMDDLNKAVDSGMKSNEATGNKYTMYPKKTESYTEPSFGIGNEEYGDSTMSAINKGMAEMNNESSIINKKEVKDLRDV